MLDATQLERKVSQLQSQIEVLKKASQAENQKIAKNMQAEAASRMEQLTQKVIFLTRQNENFVAENLALREAQLEMEKRHQDEVAEVVSQSKSSTLMLQSYDERIG